MANETVFRRYEHNPIVTPAAVPTANSIFNSAVVPFGTGFAGVFGWIPYGWKRDCMPGSAMTDWPGRSRRRRWCLSARTRTDRT